jgi:hypothetical protein
MIGLLEGHGLKRVDILTSISVNSHSHAVDHEAMYCNVDAVI